VGLKVIGRASSEAVRDLDSKSAAAKLGVGNILSGSVRRSPDTIRVSAQLINGADGTEKWTQDYDRPPGDAIRIQSDIAANVAQSLSVAIGQAARAAIALGGTSDSAAEQLLLEARKLRRSDSSPESLTKVLGLAENAIARDPRYARAYVTKGEALSAMAASYTFGVEQVHAKFQLARQAAEQALAIAPQYGAAESLVSDIKGKTLDFVGALQSAETAITLPPDDPEMLWPAIRTILYTSDRQRALKLTDGTIAIDPLSARGFGIRSEVLLRSRDYPAAIQAGHRAIALAPKLFDARVYTAQSMVLAGQLEAAKAVMSPIPANYTFPRLIKALTAARTGNRKLAEQTLHQMRMFDGDVSSYQYAQIHAQLGQSEEGMRALNKALEVRDPGLIAVKVDAFLDPIRRHARFGDLLQRLRLPGE
jgi:serine/threonine-protein kinase